MYICRFGIVIIYALRIFATLRYTLQNLFKLYDINIIGILINTNHFSAREVHKL
jgi:hypothetical protein